jgi:hypothetical protein
MFRDVLRDGTIRNVRRAPYVDEADAPLSDEPTYETRLAAEHIGRLVAGQKPFS